MPTGRQVSVNFEPAKFDLAGYKFSIRMRAIVAILAAVDELYDRLTFFAPEWSCAQFVWEDGFLILIEAWHDECKIHRVITHNDPFETKLFVFTENGVGKRCLSALEDQNETSMHIPTLTSETINSLDKQVCDIFYDQETSLESQYLFKFEFVSDIHSDRRVKNIILSPVTPHLAVYRTSIRTRALPSILVACDKLYNEGENCLPGESYATVVSEGGFTMAIEAWDDICVIHRISANSALPTDFEGAPG
jgi:hypothetical protein